MLQVYGGIRSHHILVKDLGGACDGALDGTPHAQSNRYGRPAEATLLQLTVINPTVFKVSARNQNAPVNHYQFILRGHLNKRRRYCLDWCMCIMLLYRVEVKNLNVLRLKIFNVRFPTFADDQKWTYLMLCFMLLYTYFSWQVI